MRKIEVPIIILVIAGIIAFVFFFGKDKNKEDEAPKFIGAVGMISTSRSVKSQQGDYFVFTEDSKNYGLINEKDEVILEPVYGNIVYADEGYFLTKKTNEEGFYKDYIIDLEGNTKLEGYTISIIKNKDKVYYYVLEDKGIDIYDNEFGKYYECDDCIGNVGSYVYSNQKLYDIFNKKTYNYDKKSMYFDGNLFFNGKGAYSISDKGEFKTYKNASIDEAIVTLGNDKYFLNEEIRINKDNSITLNKNYSAKFNESCSFGGVNLYKDGELDSDDCYNIEMKNGVIILSTRNKDGSPINIAILDNGEIVKEKSHIDVIGDVIVSSFQEDRYYDLEGIKLDLKCSYIDDIADNEYLCSIPDEGVILLDKDLNPIEDAKYDSVMCKDYLCIVELNNKYGALYNGKKILDITFPMLRIEDNILFVEGISENLVVKLGTENIDYNIVYNESKFKEVDVNKVIEDYDLQEIEKEIRDNEELFQKYAYIVINNDGLSVEYEGKKYDYSRQVLIMFRTFVDNKEYLNEYYMLSSLKDLHFIISNPSVSGAAGTYNLGEIVLAPYFADNNHTIYHELMHMVDYTINTRINPKRIFVCDGETVIYKGYKSDCEKQFMFNHSGLLTEGGAEYYSGLYNENKILGSYPYGVAGLASLSSIYGDETIRKIFFSPDSEADLFELLNKDGMTPEEFDEFLKLTDSLILIGQRYEDENFQKYLKYIIDIYKRKKGDKWYEDKEFLITLKNVNVSKLNRKIVGDEIVDKLKLPLYFEKEQELFNSIGFTYYSPFGNVIRDFDGRIYLSVQSYQFSSKKEGNIVIEYDLETGKIVDYKFYPFK